MSLSDKQKESVEDVIESSLRNKFQTHTSEPAVMPFQTRLLGKDRLAFYSFIYSLITNFGTTIFEPVAISLASNKFKVTKRHVKSGEQISEKAQYEIQKIMDNLTAAKDKPNKQKEVEMIRKVCQKGKINKLKTVKVDLFLQEKDDSIHLFDLKTAKPNISNFKDFKRTLLEWVAIFLYKNPKAKIHSYIAIPYNPYEPKSYERWTLKGMLDLDNELKVAQEFWNFLGGKNAYEEILNCFERVGIKMRKEIDDYFLKFKK